MTEATWIDSDDFASGPFAPHGNFRMRLDGGVYLVEARGPFNEEAVRAWQAARREMARRHPPGPGLVPRTVVHWIGSAMMSVQAFDRFAAGFHQFSDQVHPLGAVAWVAEPDTEGVAMMAEHFRPLYESRHTRFAQFADHGRALAWVRTAA